MVAACDGGTDGVEDGLLNPVRDSLEIDRDALSAASVRGGVGVGERVGIGVGGGEGRPVGRKMEGRSAFITTT
jgi:hypothetical protein